MQHILIGQQAKADLGWAHSQGQDIGYDVVDFSFILKALRDHEVIHALANGIKEGDRKSVV